MSIQLFVAMNTKTHIIFSVFFSLEACIPPAFANGQLTTNDKQYFKSGSEVTVTCNHIYVPVSLTAACQVDRTWVPSPQCTKITCLIPALQNGYYDFNNVQATANTRLAVQSIITPICFVGYTPTPSATGAICTEGFYPQRGGERRCVGTNLWSGEDAVCLPITCNPPKNYNHGSYNATQTVYTFRSSLKPACQTGYTLNNNDNVRVCVNNNTWSGTEPECHIVQCTAPPTIEHGSLSSGMPLFDYATVITVTCNHGYEEENGRTSVTCRDDGTWSSSFPRCVPIRCNDLSGVKHESINNYPSLTFGEVGNVSYNATFYNLKNGSLLVNCSSERKLSWINPPEFGEQFYLYIALPRSC